MEVEGQGEGGEVVVPERVRKEMEFLIKVHDKHGGLGRKRRKGEEIGGIWGDFMWFFVFFEDLFLFDCSVWNPLL